MTHIHFLVVASMALIPACKSRYGFTEAKKEGATTRSNDATPSSGSGNTGNTTPGDSSSPEDSSATDTTSSQNQTLEPAPTTPGGPVAGIEVWQDGKIVTSVQTGKPVVFKPTPWTRDTSASQGCEINRGIVQASWTIGSRQAADIQRYAGQECRLFDYSGTFTKPGKIKVQLDIISTEGEQAHSETTFTVTGESTSQPSIPVSPGIPDAPTTSPVQK